MAVIFFGLIIGTLLTMLVVPALYALLYRVAPQARESNS